MYRHVRYPCITVFKHEILNKFKSLKTIQILTYALQNIYMTRTTVQLLQNTIDIYTVSGRNVSNLLPMLSGVYAKWIRSGEASIFSFVYSCARSCNMCIILQYQSLFFILIIASMCYSTIYVCVDGMYYAPTVK
jgi:hypothetical protein